MKKILKKVFGVFGWIFFIYDVKTLFLSFMIHFALIFFLMFAVYANLGFWGAAAAFAFMYLGGAQVLMIQQLSKSNQEREAFDDAFEMRQSNEPEETNQESVSDDHTET